MSIDSSSSIQLSVWAASLQALYLKIFEVERKFELRWTSNSWVATIGQDLQSRSPYVGTGESPLEACQQLHTRLMAYCHEQRDIVLKELVKWQNFLDEDEKIVKEVLGV